MVRVGKYRSRRSKRSGGKLLGSALADQAKATIASAHKAVTHSLDHSPAEVVKAVAPHVMDHPEKVDAILKSLVHNIEPVYRNPPKYTSRFPDLSGPDPMVIAKQLRTRLGFDKAPHERHGGNVFGELKGMTKSLVDAFNPAESAKASIGEFNQIKLKDTSARGIARNMLHGYAGYLHGQAAYAKTTGLAVAPFSAMDAGIPTAGFAALGVSEDKFGDTAGTIARNI